MAKELYKCEIRDVSSVTSAVQQQETVFILATPQDIRKAHDEHCTAKVIEVEEEGRSYCGNCMQRIHFAGITTKYCGSCGSRLKAFDARWKEFPK